MNVWLDAGGRVKALISVCLRSQTRLFAALLTLIVQLLSAFLQGHFSHGRLKLTGNKSVCPHHGLSKRENWQTRGRGSALINSSWPFVWGVSGLLKLDGQRHIRRVCECVWDGGQTGVWDYPSQIFTSVFFSQGLSGQRHQIGCVPGFILKLRRIISHHTWCFTEWLWFTEDTLTLFQHPLTDYRDSILIRWNRITIGQKFWLDAIFVLFLF